jgi:hypothetical protein
MSVLKAKNECSRRGRTAAVATKANLSKIRLIQSSHSRKKMRRCMKNHSIAAKRFKLVKKYCLRSGSSCRKFSKGHHMISRRKCCTWRMIRLSDLVLKRLFQVLDRKLKRIHLHLNHKQSSYRTLFCANVRLC